MVGTGIGIKLLGFAAVDEMLDEVNPASGDMDEKLEEAARLVEADAMRMAPVDTGRLKNSIHSRPKERGKSWVVGSNVKYAPYQEYGTSKMPAQPYLRPALQKNKPKIKSILTGSEIF